MRVFTVRSGGMSALVALVACLWAAGCGDDDGDQNNNTNDTLVVCGNGAVEAGEECDDGAANSDLAPDACRSDCRLPYCGDNVQDTDESCDDGPSNSDLLANACRTDCSLPRCGDGVLDPGEECDDANAERFDGCNAECGVEYFWTCSGAPSVCECKDFRRGEFCVECVVYVDLDPSIETRDGSDWSTAFATVQEGIDVAYDNGPLCEVWVAEGTYVIFQDSPGNTVEMRDGVMVYGGFDGTELERTQRDVEANPTVLDGSASGSGTGPRTFHVVTAEDVYYARLDGFLIRHGGAIGLSETVDDRGGGLYANGSVFAVSNTVFSGNSAIRGGAVFAYASPLVFENVRFESNHVERDGGALYALLADVDLTGCVFADNTASEDVVTASPAYGGAIYVVDSDPTIAQSVFVGNVAYGQIRGGGAITALGESSMTIAGCAFLSNYTAGRGAAIFNDEGASMTVSRSIFLANVAELGAPVLYASANGLPLVSDHRFEACSFVGNTTQGAGALWLNGNLRLEVVNSLFLGNRAAVAAGVLVSGHATNQAVVTNSTFYRHVDGVASWGQGELTVTNSVLWNGTSSSPVFAATNPLVTVSHSVVEATPVPTGVGNWNVDPALAGPPESPLLLGTWTAAATYDDLIAQHILEDSTASWTVDEHRRRVLRTPAGWFWVVANDATRIYAYGNPAVMPPAGGGYAILDFRPTAGSVCVDHGDDSAVLRLPTDFTEIPWVDAAGGTTGTTTDIGAFEGG